MVVNFGPPPMCVPACVYSYMFLRLGFVKETGKFGAFRLEQFQDLD